MKNLIIFIIAFVILAFIAQNYTDFKAVDLGKEYLQKIEQKISGEGWLNWLKGFVREKIKTYQGPPADKNLNIFIRDGKFLPNKSGVLKGTKVTWYNQDVKTQTVSGEGWGSSEIPAGGTFVKTFDIDGDFTYSSSNNPKMTGEIIVQ